MICTKITKYLQKSVLPHWPVCMLVLDRFDWDPVTVWLPTIIAVGSGSDFCTGRCHGWFGHTILQLKTTPVRFYNDKNC